MKKFIEYLKNCWKVEDLRERILITILFVAIYRFGSFVVLPGINPSDLENLQSQTAGGLMSLLDAFSGGAFSHASIFALGIMPYISASIVTCAVSRSTRNWYLMELFHHRWYDNPCCRQYVHSLAWRAYYR